MRLLAPMILMAGCASVQGDQEPPSGKALKDPKKLLATFREFVRIGELSKAHECLSKGAKQAVQYEAFFAIMTAFDATGRLIAGLEDHVIDAEKGTIRLCNPEFGISREFRIVREFNIIWKFDFSREDLEYFQNQALAWFRKQNEAAGHRHFVYPPNWKYSKVIPHCECKKDG